ncbi:MAG: SRPBCC family protein, partial [Acidimicrobiales bacterium]
MRRSTHYVFHAVWDVSAGFDDVCTVLSHPETYSAWWPEIRSVTPRASGRFEMVARSVLPYDLRFVSEEVE